MAGSVLPFDQSAHKVVDVLLPWFVNGTLDRDERELVQQHLRECTQCRQQVEWLRDLHAACIAGSMQPGASKAFERLRHELGKPSARLNRGPRRRTGWMRSRFVLPWAIAASMTIVAIGGMWGTAIEERPAYRTLGSDEIETRPQATVVVVFDPATREAEIRRILRAAEARLVDGPTATNAYMLDVEPTRRQRALELLRTERAVVLAQPFGSGATH